jgi:DNA repair protein SbcD/Mre11
MALKLLAVGDLHLGRRPGGLPGDLAEGAAARALGPAVALGRLVAAAIASDVDVVALAGDVVEQEDDFFEAYADLYRAVHALTEADIRVVAVAGNHDVRVLPRLADELPGFHLLGRAGTWEALQVRSADGIEAVLHGWSFPQPVVRTNPVLGHRFVRDQRTAIGLLHCDRDQAESPHAPVSSRALADAGLDAWLLGHIHKPDALSIASPSGYLGSVTALRRSETGARGPWLYTIGAGGIVGVEQWPLAPLRWEALDVDVGAVSDAEEARGRLLGAVRNMAAPLVAGAHGPDALGLRVRLTGRTVHRAAVEANLQADLLTDIPVGARLRCFVGTLVNDTQPDVDLEMLARQPDPAGLLARRLRVLEGLEGDPAERAALLERARVLTAMAGDAAWQPLHRGAPEDADLVRWLRRAALTSLDALLAQRREERS